MIALENIPASHTFDESAEIERQYQLENFRSDNFADGLNAFLDRRTRE